MVEALVSLSEVAGNHSRFLYDFAPESVVFRVTDDMAPRLLYCFEEETPGGNVTSSMLEDRVASKDINPKELYVGGAIARTPAGIRLRALGANVDPGIRSIATMVQERLRGALKAPAKVAA